MTRSGTKGGADGKPVSIAVLGAGSWGTALAMQLARNGLQVHLWARNAEHVADMRTERRNRRFLPDHEFPAGIQPESELERAVRASSMVMLAVPSHAFTQILSEIEPWLAPGSGVSWACKGLEPGTGEFLHVAAQKVLRSPRELAVLTGPSFAAEVAANLPTAVTVAGTDENWSGRVASAFHGGNFRAYTSTDIVGAELGGAVKNVLAVATGICDGMRLGNNARAALVTRGLAEMTRLGSAVGAELQTLMGLAGMGDLVLTCTGDLSRNRRLGLALGAGQSIDRAVAEIGQVVEGVQTAEEVWRLANRHGVEMPISEQVYGVLHRGQDPYESLKRLLSREPRAETD